jgi:ribose transport system substrate-binding protein
VEKKKYLIDLMVIVSALALFFIWHNKNYEAVPTSSLRNEKIYLITMDKTDQFWTYLDEGAGDMAELLGVTYQWEGPQERDVQEQINIFRNAVEAGADAILLAASDPVRISRAVEDAKARGVKIIYVDAPAVEEAVVILATDNYRAGRIAGETMITELEAVGIRGGSIGIIGVTPENSTTINRERGFRDAISENGNYVLLDTKFSNGDAETAQEKAQEFINESLDLVGLFGTNEGSTEGVGNAIKANNKKIIGIGFDISDTIQEMIRDDVLQSVMVQNPYTMGYLGMAEAVAALKGYDTGPPFIDTGVSVFNKYTPRRPDVR